MAKQEDVFKKVVSHAKEYGFIFPSSEVYDGLSAIYDYGQNGAELKNNIKQYWWKAMVQMNENIVGIDSAIFMHPTIWKASGHVDAFNDPLIDNKDSNKRYRVDHLIESHAEKLALEGKKEEEFALLQKKVVASGQNQSQYCRNVLLNSSVTPIIQSVSRDQELQSFRTNFSRISNYIKFKDPLLNLEVMKVIEKMNHYLDDRNRENH